MGGGESSTHPQHVNPTYHDKRKRRNRNNRNGSAPPSTDTSPVGPTQSQLALEPSPNTIFGQKYNPFETLADLPASDANPTNSNTDTGVDNMDTATEKKSTETGTPDAKVTETKQTQAEIIAAGDKALKDLAIYITLGKPLKETAASAYGKSAAATVSSVAGMFGSLGFGSAGSAGPRLDAKQGLFTGLDADFSLKEGAYSTFLQKLADTKADQRDSRDALFTVVQSLKSASSAGSKDYKACCDALEQCFKDAFEKDADAQELIRSLQALTHVIRSDSQTKTDKEKTNEIKNGNTSLLDDAVERAVKQYPANLKYPAAHKKQISTLDAKIAKLSVDFYRLEEATKSQDSKKQPTPQQLLHRYYEALILLKEIADDVCTKAERTQLDGKIDAAVQTILHAHDNRDEHANITAIHKGLQEICQKSGELLRDQNNDRISIDLTHARNLLSRIPAVANLDFCKTSVRAYQGALEGTIKDEKKMGR